jgi:two-component system LytT family response regulator
VRDEDRLRILHVAQIDWFESLGNYVRVHSNGHAYLIRMTMDAVERRLAGRSDFVRVRRSAIINIGAVAALERYAKSSYLIHLRHGGKVISSRYYLPVMRQLLDG